MDYYFSLVAAGLGLTLSPFEFLRNVAVDNLGICGGWLLGQILYFNRHLSSLE